MNTLYLDCNMGASGDMLFAALLDLCPDPSAALAEINAWKLPGVEIKMSRMDKCGISCNHVDVFINGKDELEADCSDGGAHSHAHNALSDIHDIITSLPVCDRVKADAIAVYDLIAAAESKVHNSPVELVHLHEVGAIDAVCDITAVCFLIDKLGVDWVISSPVITGFGQVQCAHGRLPVPAPATAELLRGVPNAQGQIRGELCTPTGAALIRHFVKEFGTMPVMTINNTSYGCGKKDFSQPNCIRAFLGDTYGCDRENVCLLSANIDDATPEELSFAGDILRDEGALDVYSNAIMMKKGRIGIELKCLCREADEEKFAALIFKHTPTLGIRAQKIYRYTLNRHIKTVDTPYGELHVKESSGFGVTKSKPEFEDLKAMAQKSGKSFAALIAEFRNNPND